MKRKHQVEMERARDDIIAGQNIEYILASVTPGGGKSALPIIISKLIDAGLANKICWVVPRKSLQSQGEHNFMDPFFRDLFKHQNRIRASTNDKNPSRGLEGCITTYQAIGLDDKNTLLKDFSSRRYILVLDEFHHAGEGSTWEGALNRLVTKAAYVVLMTGTLQRGDGTAIAFLPYASNRGDKVPILESSEQLGLRVIRYSRTDALSEKAIIPLVFNFADARVSWQTGLGDQVDYESMASVKTKDASDAIYTALTTEYAEQLLDQAIVHWTEHRCFNRRAKMLVVTAGIETAKRAVSYLKRKCYNAEIATSHESKAAHRAINRFKQGNIDILVTIAMAYEGLDVPAVTHLVSLTHIRSRPWIEQMLARAVRVDHLAGPWEHQRAYIWTPDDPIMRKIVDDIEAEQVAHVTSYKSGDQIELFGSEEGEGEGPGRRGIIPLSSSIIGSREAVLGGPTPALVPSPAPTEKTPSELESELREQIEQHVRTYSFMHRYMNGRVNREIRGAMQKPRAEMTLQELRQCYAYVRQTYPLTARQYTKVQGVSGPRTHRKRVSTQVKIWKEQ